MANGDQALKKSIRNARELGATYSSSGVTALGL
jgi:hypothetical protein